MLRIRRLVRCMEYALAACLFVLGSTVTAQQGNQPSTKATGIRPVAQEGANGAAVQKTRSARTRLGSSESTEFGSSIGRQRVANALATNPCSVKKKNPRPPTFTQSPDCKYAARGQECVIRVDRTNLAAVGTQEVASGTAVHILVYHKSPFEKVRFESERKEVAPPPDPVTGLISMISGAAGGITGASKTLLGIAITPSGCTPTPDQKRLEAMIKTLVERIRVSGRIQEAETVRAAYDALAEQLDQFFGKDFCQQNDPVHISGDFETERVTMVEQICLQVTGKPPLSTEGEDQLLKDIGELLKKIVLDPATDLKCLDSEISRINDATGTLRLLKDAIAKLDEARKHFADIRDTLIDLEGAQCAQDIRVVADRQADIVGNLVIKNVITGKDDDKKLFTKVKFRDLPRASISTGVLVSSLEKRKFAVVPVFDAAGTNATDPVQSHKEIRGEQSRPQVIPFSFINVRVADWQIGKRLLTINLAPGIGINPNNGTTETEFAFGPSVGIGNVYFFGGVHFGRQPDLINGFSIGNRVPDTFTAPVGRSWKKGFGFGISYRLPLP